MHCRGYKRSSFSYTTIVSYESELLREFSFCILQKNNIFNYNAKIPEFPKVTLVLSWRGKALTQEDVQQILTVHLDDEDAPEGGQKSEVSWIVAATANFHLRIRFLQKCQWSRHVV